MIGIDNLCACGIAEWNKTNECSDLKNWYIDEEQRQHVEVQTDKIMKEILPFWRAFPNTPRSQKRWRQKGLKAIDSWMNQGDLPLFKEMNREVAELFREITFSFLRDVRSFDRQLSLADTMQALRNVWIIAILQCLFKKQIGYHPAMFAYSMLYPYTDNFLDDEHYSTADKKAFNDWLDARLRGIGGHPRNDHEIKIDRLVGMIERQFPRKTYPLVYESLYEIQSAQIASLRQQDGMRICTTDELLAISYRKGGTSVVADGALIDGMLNEKELSFCMKYGFMLQLGDDIQDAHIDGKHHHQTLASMYSEVHYDVFIRKLLQYVEDICTEFKTYADPTLVNFVAENCRYLIFASLLQHDAVAISPILMREVQQCLPVSQGFIDDKKALWPYSYTEEEWWARLDVLLQ